MSFFLQVLLILGIVAPLWGEAIGGKNGLDKAEEELTEEQVQEFLDHYVPLPIYSEELDSHGEELTLLAEDPDYVLFHSLLEKVAIDLKSTEEKEKWTVSGSIVPGEVAEQKRQTYHDFFAYRRPYFLYDPEGCLTTFESQETEGYLKKHAGSSEVNVYVLVLDPERLKNQEEIARLSAGYFNANEQGILLLYYYGEPNQAWVEVSKSTRGIFPLAQESLLLARCRKPAAQESQEALQLSQYLSVFTYELERVITPHKRSAEELAKAKKQASEFPKVVVEEGAGLPKELRFRMPVLPRWAIELCLWALLTALAVGAVLAGFYWHLHHRTLKVILNTEAIPLQFPRGTKCSGTMRFFVEAQPPEQQTRSLYQQESK